jgi:hypothetical protein
MSTESEYPKIVTLQPLRHDGYEYPGNAEVVNMSVEEAHAMSDDLVIVVDGPEDDPTVD